MWWNNENTVGYKGKVRVELHREGPNTLREWNIAFVNTYAANGTVSPTQRVSTRDLSSGPKA